MRSLFISTNESSPAQKAVINLIVVCSTFSLLGYFVFNSPSYSQEQASTLDYLLALEPLFSLMVIMLGVRTGWIEWAKESYDRMKFPLSGAELLTLVGFASGFCLVQQLDLPIHPDASSMNLASYVVICAIFLPGLVWTGWEDKASQGKISVWSSIWRALMMFAIAADIFLSLNIASATRTERIFLGQIHGKYSTTGSKGIAHYYHVNVTPPTDSNDIVSLTIDRASWDRLQDGDAIKLRLFQGGLGQDYWRYER